MSSQPCRSVVFSAVLALAASAMPTAARAAAITATEARISAVTVYSDRAEVIREGRIAVPTGASVVQFEAIPIGVEADSLRVSAEGVPAILGAVEIVDAAAEPQESAEYLAARQEVERLEQELAVLKEDETVDGRLRDFLGALQASSAERVSRDLGEGRADPAALSGVYEMLRTNYGSLTGRKLERANRAREVSEALQIAAAKLSTLRPATGIRSRIAAVEIETRQAGSLTVRLAYVVPGASWRPSYRATLDAATGQVNLVAEGVVRQSTMEDWSGVRLGLSSAAPARGVEPPMLEPWVLRPAPLVGEMSGFAKAKGDREKDERFYQNTLGLAPGVADVPASPSEIAQARLVMSAYNVAFEVPGKSAVPADGREHRVALRTENLAGKLVLRVIPALEPRAYLTSVTTSPAEYPLLAGPVRVFAGGAYLGSFRLEEKGPGVELTLPFGVDNRLEVVHVREPQSAGKGGVAGNRRDVQYAFRTQLHNLQDKAVSVVLEDRVPVSEDERIIVEIDDKRTTGGYEDSPRRPGVKLWTFDLAPGEKREIALAYGVRYPKELFVPDLE